MGLLEALAGTFIQTFGITQPTPAQRRNAAWFILGMLTLVAVGLCVGALVLYRILHV